MLIFSALHFFGIGEGRSLNSYPVFMYWKKTSCSLVSFGVFREWPKHILLCPAVHLGWLRTCVQFYFYALMGFFKNKLHVFISVHSRWRGMLLDLCSMSRGTVSLQWGEKKSKNIKYWIFVLEILIIEGHIKWTKHHHLSLKRECQLEWVRLNTILAASSIPSAVATFSISISMHLNSIILGLGLHISILLNTPW